MADLLNLSSRAPQGGASSGASAAAPGKGSATGPAVGHAQAGDLIKDGNEATFVEDVIKASQQVPVIIDLWAPWCGPCKTLGPILEKTVLAAKGAVKLVKINVDENPRLSAQLRVQSIPAVYAFSKGQPVDGFIGALSESQVRTFVQGLIGELGPAATDELIAEAQAARAEGDLGTAAALFAEVVKQEPSNVAALAGLAQVYLDSGDIAHAEQTLELVPPDKAGDGAVRAVQAAITLRGQAKPAGETAKLEQKLASDPNDHQARYDLAVALAAADRKAEAIDHLLDLIKRNRTWNEDAARKQLLTLFDALGFKDELAQSGRRRLSALLFT